MRQAIHSRRIDMENEKVYQMPFAQVYTLL